MRLLHTKSSTLRRVVSAALLIAGGSGAVWAAERHLMLIKSEPANAATVTKAPEAITLWFSQRPNIKLTRLVLINEERDTLETGDPAIDDSTGKQIRIAVESELTTGKYEVNWRTVARDGHAVAGKFAFTLDTLAGSKALSLRQRR